MYQRQGRIGSLMVIAIFTLAMIAPSFVWAGQASKKQMPSIDWGWMFVVPVLLPTEPGQGTTTTTTTTTTTDDNNVGDGGQPDAGSAAQGAIAGSSSANGVVSGALSNLTNAAQTATGTGSQTNTANIAAVGGIPAAQSTAASAPSNKTAQTANIALNTVDASNQGNGSNGGDPVRLATGAFIMNEEDDSYNSNNLKISLSRTYVSTGGSAHSLGQGWAFSYDTRVIRGSIYKASDVIDSINGQITILNDSYDKQETDSTNALKGIGDQLTAARNLLGDETNPIAGTAYYALAAAQDAVDKAIATGVQNLILAANNELTTAKGLVASINGVGGIIDSLTAEQGTVQESQKGLEAIQTAITDLKVELASYQVYVDESAANAKLNRLVTSSGDLSSGQYTGNGTIVFVDERGSSHLLMIEADANPDSTVTLPDGSRNYYPSGSALLPAPDQPMDDSLALESDGSYVRTTKDGTRYLYTYLGQLDRIIDTNGNTLTFGYSTVGELTSITDDYGRATTFAWTNGRITTIAAPAGRTVCQGSSYSPTLGQHIPPGDLSVILA